MIPKKHLKACAALATASAFLAGKFAYAHDHHEDDHDHDHHHRVYIDRGEVDLALFYHEDEAKFSWLIYSDQDHDHHHEHEQDDDDHHDDDDDHGGHDDHDHHNDHDDHDHHHDHEHGEGLDPDDTVMIAGADARHTVPENPAFAFLGEAGSSIWVLPQDPTAGPAAPGFSFEVHDDIFVDDRITVHLVDVHGPGHFALYVVDSFGDPIVYMNTRDGISDDDRFEGMAETHNHLAWAFSEPGLYEVILNATATLIDGEATIESGPTVFLFQVGEALDYLRGVEEYEDGWAEVEGLGWMFTGSFPWLWSEVIGWVYASGPGGETMYLYSETLAAWLFTNPDTYPWCYRFDDSDWLYIQETPDGTWYWSLNSGQWQPW